MLSLNRTPMHARLATGKPYSPAGACCRPRPCRRSIQPVRAASVQTPTGVGPVCRELLWGVPNEQACKSLQRGWRLLLPDPSKPDNQHLFSEAHRVVIWWADQCRLSSSNKEAWEGHWYTIQNLLVVKAYQEYQSQMSAAQPSDREPAAAVPYTKATEAAGMAALDAVLLRFLKHAALLGTLSCVLPPAASTDPAEGAAAQPLPQSVVFKLERREFCLPASVLYKFVSAAQNSLSRALVAMASDAAPFLGQEQLQPLPVAPGRQAPCLPPPVVAGPQALPGSDPQQGRIHSLEQQAAEQQQLLEQLQSKLDQQSGLLQTLLGRYTSEQLGVGSIDSTAAGCKAAGSSDSDSGGSSAGSDSSADSSSSSAGSNRESGADTATPVAAEPSGSLPDASWVTGLHAHLLAHKGGTLGPFQLSWPHWAQGSDGKVVASKRLVEFQAPDASGALYRTTCLMTITALPILSKSGGCVEVGFEVGLALRGKGVNGPDFDGGLGHSVPMRIKAGSSGRLYFQGDAESRAGELFTLQPMIPVCAGDLVFGGRGLVVRWVLPEAELSMLGLIPREYTQNFARSRSPSKVVLDLSIEYEVGL